MGLELNWNLLRCCLKLWENYNEIIFYFYKGTFGPIILLSVVRNFILTNQNPDQQISWTLRFSARPYNPPPSGRRRPVYPVYGLGSQPFSVKFWQKITKTLQNIRPRKSSKKLKIIFFKNKIKNGRNIKKELEIQQIAPSVCRLPRSSIVKSNIPMQKWTSVL